MKADGCPDSVGAGSFYLTTMKQHARVRQRGTYPFSAGAMTKYDPKLGVNLSLRYSLIEKIDELAKREADGNRSEMHERLVLEALEARRAVKPHTTQP